MNDTITGRFISLEGGEGAGKTTLIQSLKQRLGEQGIDVVTTREPGGSPFAEVLRGLLLDPNLKMTDDSELLLMFAARADHLAATIEPALNRHQWVLCDRFIDSTIAYQGFGRYHGDPSLLNKIHALIERFVPRQPDLTLWLDLPIEQGLSRAKNRGSLDRFEQQQAAFFERVQAGFAYCYEQNPHRIVRLDASRSPTEVLAAAMAVLMKIAN